MRLSLGEDIRNGKGAGVYARKECLSDVFKPANILVAKGSNQAFLTDLGAAVDLSELEGQSSFRVHFTWTYAHSELTDMIRDVKSITGGGLKPSACLDSPEDIAKFDLFALGKTMQEMLAILEKEFKERCHSSYSFRFLHLTASLLLDGFNAVGGSVHSVDGLSFVGDSGMDYPVELFQKHKIKSASDLVDRLSRFSRDYSWNVKLPELDMWQPETINSVVNAPTAFSSRVAQILDHPAVRRLKDERQLGLVCEIFPGATHDRWVHSLGVFSLLTSYYRSLWADPEIPTFRLLADPEDLCHGFVAALLHDIGQTSLSHDLEEACPAIFSHEDVVDRLLNESSWGGVSLNKTIQEIWPEIDVGRITTILKYHRSRKKGGPQAQLQKPIDGVTADALDGPIDADKVDYIIRDSIACGVPYGHGIDLKRFLAAVNVHPLPDGRLGLAYKAKGRAAVQSLQLARLQMYGAVYWHHTFRCLQSMLYHATRSTFGRLEKSAYSVNLEGLSLSRKQVKDLFYHKVICGKFWNVAASTLSDGKQKQLLRMLSPAAPPYVASWPELDFIWVFSSPPIKELISDIATRRNYKRVYEVRKGELNDSVEFAELKVQVNTPDRCQNSEKIQINILNKIDAVMRTTGPTSESMTENAARTAVQNLRKMQKPLILLDFPTRGVPSEDNIPCEIADSSRKYSTVGSPPDTVSVYSTIRQMQQKSATLRVFAEPLLHDLIMRYLKPLQVERCVTEVIPLLRQKK